ncbi:MAG: sigma-70 family RNA polymerase sigma factor [Planctomycetota bacterium]
MPESDEATRKLLLCIARGDDLAMQRLYEQERGPLMRLFTGLSGCRSQAEDLLQGTFLSLWKFRANYQGRGKAGAYIYKVAMNQWRGSFARERRQQETWEQMTPDWQESYQENPGARLELGELKQSVWNGIRSLPLPQREVFLLHRFCGLSCPKVAEATGVNLKTVESRLRLALRKMVEMLQVRESQP